MGQAQGAGLSLAGPPAGGVAWSGGNPFAPHADFDGGKLHPIIAGRFPKTNTHKRKAGRALRAEVVRLAWPVLLGTGSCTLMQLFDPLFLAHYDLTTTQAALPAGILAAADGRDIRAGVGCSTCPFPEFRCGSYRGNISSRPTPAAVYGGRGTCRRGEPDPGRGLERGGGPDS